MKSSVAPLLLLGPLLFGTVSVYAQSAEDAELKGESAGNNGDLNGAIGQFTEAIRLDPKFSLAYRRRGLALHHLRDYGNAIADFNEAIRLDPKCTDGYICRGNCYSDKDDFDKALADYFEAIHLDANCITAYIERAHIYGFNGDCDRAMADAAKAVRLDPNYAAAQNALGVAYNDYALKILKSDSKTAEALFDHASAYFDAPPAKLDDAQQRWPLGGSVESFRAATRKLDNTHKAQLLFDYSAAAFSVALDIRPDYDFGNNNLGVYYARRNAPGDIQLAEKCFRAALKSNPRYADGLNNLGIVLTRQGKFDEAIATHKAGLAVRNNRASDHNTLARAYLARGDLDNALEETSISLQCDPNYCSAWICRAEVFMKQDKLEDSEECVRRITEIDPRAPEAVLSQLIVAAKHIDIASQPGMATDHLGEATKHLNAAIDWLDRIVKVDPSVERAYYARGIAYMQKKDLLRAKQDFEEALRLHPEFPGAHEKLNTVRRQLGKSSSETERAKDPLTDSRRK
jgi:tetratricopeptide (TPR) repeat protein